MRATATEKRIRLRFGPVKSYRLDLETLVNALLKDLAWWPRAIMASHNWQQSSVGNADASRGVEWTSGKAVKCQTFFAKWR
jgi:hypothetical protein